MDLIGRGKAGLIDPSDGARLQALLASPGDEAYIEGESIGGTEIDPFPNRFRESGDFALTAHSTTQVDLPKTI